MCAEFKIVVFTRNTLSRLTAPVPPPTVFIHLIPGVGGPTLFSLESLVLLYVLFLRSTFKGGCFAFLSLYFYQLFLGQKIRS